MEHDCIIVLANEMDKEGNLNLESMSRIKLARESYSKNPATTLITCGWNYRKDSKLFIGDVMKEYAVKLGIPSEKIITELNSRDTVGEAFFTKINILKNNDWKNLLIVTSDYHVFRASKIFKFIYGAQYEIKVIGSSGFDSFEKQSSEKKSIEAFEHTFKVIKPGDDKEIYDRLSIQHPFYNGEIYPKINLNMQNNETTMTLRKATFDDWQFLLDWRNDLETRENSHNMELVEEENHKKWLNSILSNENRQLFIAIEKEIPVGTVRADFDNQNAEYELSWTISPDFRGKGIGKKMIKLLSNKLQAKIRAEIKKENISSVKIAEFSGMTFKKEENGILHFSNH